MVLQGTPPWKMSIPQGLIKNLEVGLESYCSCIRLPKWKESWPPRHPSAASVFLDPKLLFVAVHKLHHLHFSLAVTSHASISFVVALHCLFLPHSSLSIQPYSGIPYLPHGSFFKEFSLTHIVHLWHFSTQSVAAINSCFFHYATALCCTFPIQL